MCLAHRLPAPWPFQHHQCCHLNRPRLAGGRSQMPAVGRLGPTTQPPATAPLSGGLGRTDRAGHLTAVARAAQRDEGLIEPAA